MHHVVLDRWSRGASILHQRDPRSKVLALLVLLVALATASRNLLLFGAGLVLLLLAGFAVARIPVLGAMARAALVLPFTAVFAAISWLAGDPARAVSLLVKSYLSALAVVFVVSTTPLPALLDGLQGLGAPRFLLQVGQFLYRYLFLISEEAQHMMKAAASRGASLRQWKARPQGFRAAAGILAVLFARSYNRAGGVHSAMLARGFQGVLPRIRMSRFEAWDALFILAASLLVIALRLGADRIAR